MIKNLVREFKDGTWQCDGQMYVNVINGGRAIKQIGYSYFFYCDAVNEDALNEYCEEHQLAWDSEVVPSKRMNKYGTKERVKVEIWSLVL